MTEFLFRTIIVALPLILVPLFPWPEIDASIGTSLGMFLSWIWDFNKYIPIDTISIVFFTIIIIESGLLIIRLIGQVISSVTGSDNFLKHIGTKKG